MKPYSQQHKIISVIMIFIILIHFPGCVSSRIIATSSEIPSGTRYHFIVYKETSFIIENVEIKDEILSGEIVKENKLLPGSKVYLYISDPVIKIDTAMILSIPVNSIDKIKITRFSAPKTILIVGAGAYLLLFISYVAFVNWLSSFGI